MEEESEYSSEDEEYSEEEYYDEEEEEEEEEQRISAEQAKLIFGLTDKDLARLSRPRLRAHPDDPAGRPLKFYLESEVEDLCDTLERQERRAEDRGRKRAVVIAALRKAKAAQRKRNAREAANTWLRSLGGGRARAEAKHGASPLPGEVLALVFDRLVADLEPGGVWGPGLVARQLASASLVCWDWYHAAGGAFAKLADAVARRHLGQVVPSYRDLWDATYHRPYQPALTWARAPAGLGWRFWDTLVAAPADHTLAQLWQAADGLWVEACGTKPQLILRLLSALGLAGPTPVPARLLRAVALERSMPRTFDGPDRCVELMRLVRQLNVPHTGHTLPIGAAPITGSLAAIRRALAAAGVRSVAELRVAVVEAQIQARVARVRELEESGQRPCAVCVERKYAYACPNKCCGHCCGGPAMQPCQRHAAWRAPLPQYRSYQDC